VKDIDPGGRVVSGFTVVAEAIARRWVTPRGRLIGYPNYGFDLTQYVNADMNPRDIAGLSAGAAAEALKDERVESCAVTATLLTGILTVVAEVETAQGPFTLTVAVSDVTVQLLEVS
jgi:phage baseplate assembly protein W